MKYLFLSLTAFTILTSCSEMAQEEKTLWISSQKVDCVGVAPMKCMQVKEAEDAEWTLFYDQIVGFDYEEGFNYKVRVNVTERENPPADASSLVYTLVEVVSKDAVAADRTPMPPARGDLYDREWRLRMIMEGGEATRIGNDQEVTLTISSETSGISGKAACNNYFGGTQIDGTTMRVMKIGSTRKMCADEELMNLERRYLTLLENVNQISPNRSSFLTLLTNTGAELQFVPVPPKEGN